MRTKITIVWEQVVKTEAASGPIAEVESFRFRFNLGLELSLYHLHFGVGIWL